MDWNTFFYADYPEAVKVVYQGYTPVSGCVIKNEHANEFLSILIEDCGGPIPQATIIWTGSRKECEHKIRERLDR